MPLPPSGNFSKSTHAPDNGVGVSSKVNAAYLPPVSAHHLIKPDGDSENGDITVRAMREADLPEVDHIFRLAFGTFINLPDPMAFAAGADLIGPRFRHDPDGMFVAEINGRIMGSALANRWGSVGFFGPLTVHPEAWDQGVGRRLMEPCMDSFTRWNCTHTVLFTFPHSTKHVGLYQKFGFWPRFLTVMMSKNIGEDVEPFKPLLFSSLSDGTHAGMLRECLELTSKVYPGLDLTQEIINVHRQQLGETILLHSTGVLEAIAICQFGLGTEGGPDTCYVKFAAVSPGATAPAHFEQLLNACESLAAQRGLKRVFAGVSTARHEAYRQMIDHGFRNEVQGLGMALDNTEGYSRPGLFVLDDWR